MTIRLLSNPFVAEVMEAAEIASRAAGYTLLFAFSDRDPERGLEAIRQLLDRQVDGLIVISGRAGPRYAGIRSLTAGEAPNWPLGGALYGPSSYFMKSLSEQYTDDAARTRGETFITGSDHYGQPEFELTPGPAVEI